MNGKRIVKRMVPLLLAFVLVVSGAAIAPVTAHAAGWPDYAKDLTLGSAVTGSIKIGDYNGTVENVTSTSDTYKYYWNVYRFSMPQSGLLNVYIESGESKYLAYETNYDSGKYNGFAIFSASSPDELIWRSRFLENQIAKEYSSARETYYGSTEISLEEGTYYFVVRQQKTLDKPYYLTLSYKEPRFNVTSITFDKPKLKMEAGTRQEVRAAVYPDNATDKTLVWKSTAPSVATVENGVISAVSAGTASITATSADGETSAVCEVTVSASVNSYDYRILAEGGIEITSYKGEDRAVSVPSAIDGRNVVSLGDDAFQNGAALTDVELPEGMTAIGAYAFQNCSSLTEMIFPETVSSVGAYAFQNCGSLTNIKLPEDITGIGDCTFQNCSRLTSAGLPESITVIGRSAFSSCSSLENIELPESLTDIGDYAFYGCAGLKVVEIPENVENIGSAAFARCDNLILKVEKGSYAESYAKNNHLNYQYPDGSVPDSGGTGEGNEGGGDASALCIHSYKTAVMPATMGKNGSVTEKCSKCGKVKSQTVIYAADNAALARTSYTYNGREQKPAVIVKDSRGRTLKNGEDYIISYPRGMKNVGRYTVTVTLKGKYSGTMSGTFDIVPKGTSISRLSSKKKGLTIKWRKQPSQITGYEIQYSFGNKFGRKGTKTVTAGRSRTTLNVTSGIKAKKRYYVRIRTYKKVKVNGMSVKLCSGWSKTKKL